MAGKRNQRLAILTGADVEASDELNGNVNAKLEQVCGTVAEVGPFAREAPLLDRDREIGVELVRKAIPTVVVTDCLPHVGCPWFGKVIVNVPSKLFHASPQVARKVKPSLAILAWAMVVNLHFKRSVPWYPTTPAAVGASALGGGSGYAEVV
jgi:hypothetical protein